MRKAWGVAAVVGMLLAAPGTAGATEVNAIDDPRYQSFNVQATTYVPALGVELLTTPMDVLVEPAADGQVRITERSSLLLLGTQGLTPPTFECSYVVLLQSATCPGRDGGGVGGGAKNDRAEVRGVRALWATMGAGNDVLVVTGSGPAQPGPIYDGSTYIQVEGGLGADTISVERGNVFGGPGGDVLTTPGGGAVGINDGGTGDRIDVADGEGGDVVTCNLPVLQVQRDAGDWVAQRCFF